MPRRREVPKPEILADPKFVPIYIAKFIDVLVSAGKKARPHGLDGPAEWSILEPVWERPAGPKTTRAEQDQS